MEKHTTINRYVAKAVIIGIVSIITAFIATKYYHKHLSCMDNNGKNDSSSNAVAHSKPDAPIDLVWTPKETAEFSKWKHDDKSFEEMMDDAYTGDRAALYMLGMTCLMGHQELGITIDTETANLYFAKSASLGFAPALDKMRAMYMDEGNPWLMMVYVNLTASLGHPEFTIAYHNLRSRVVEKFGSLLASKIEDVAAQKLATIIRNQKDLEEAADKVKFLFSMREVTDQDVLLDNQYWCQYAKLETV